MELVSINHIMNSVVLTMLVIVSMSILINRNLFINIIFLSIFSLLMATIYLILGAPDVAITEAAIGTGISTFLFLGTLLLTGENEKECKTPILALIAIILTGSALIFGITSLPSFGDVTAVTNQHLAPFFLSESESKMGIPNVVTSILASYRAFDTLGEAFVVFTAAISILLILRGNNEDDDDEELVK